MVRIPLFLIFILFDVFLFSLKGIVDSESGKIEWKINEKYDKGLYPRISINNSGQCLEIHKSQNFDTLYYHIGNIKNGNSIIWSNSIRMFRGAFPCVCISNTGMIIEFHQTAEDEGYICYTLGKLKN